MEAFRWCLAWRWRWWRLPGPAQKALGPALRWRLGGRYRLIEPIGRGGWSTVWRGYDERLSRPVAIKLLDASQAEWVQREAKALASLTHAHIAMIYDCDCTGSECYLVL